MSKYFLFFYIVLFFWGCRQNGEVKKKRALEFEEISKEIASLDQNSNNSNNSNSVEELFAPVKRIKVVKKFPHDPKAYTQGLFFYGGYLFESTGLVGNSSLRKVELESGKVLKKIDIKGGIFAEGIDHSDNKIFQLSWTSGICFVYNFNTFEKIAEFQYQGEGWGLTLYNNNFIMSNGTNILKFMRTDNFGVNKFIQVNDNGRPIYYLNEMEIIEGEIWANIYGSSRIAVINPETGSVNFYIDLSILYEYMQETDNPEVLNGIAFDKDNKRIFVTGKYWKYIFEIEIVN